MKAFLPLLALALLLAGCTTPDESGDGAQNGTNTDSDVGGEVSTEIEVTENETAGSGGNSTSTNTTNTSG